MATTYEKIQTTTIGSPTNTVAFTSIPSTYTDLIIVFNGTMTGSALKYLQFNSDTGANYSCVGLFAYSTTVASAQYANAWLDVANNGAQPYVTLVQINNYSNSTAYKTYISREGSAGAAVQQINGMWRSTSAITRIDIPVHANNYNTGTVVTLYGIKAA